MDVARTLMPDVTFCEDAYSCAEGASALVLVTEWDAYRALDFVQLGAAMNAKVLVDLRNVYRPEDVRRRGFAYTGIGRA